MADPVPKPRSQRRRRNADPSTAKLTAEPRARGRTMPELPMTEPHQRTRLWWEAVWRSPMAAIWMESDEFELLLMADLQDQAFKGQASAALLSELRQLKDRFGLSPLARRRLAWEVEQATAAGEGETKKAEADGPQQEDQRWLRVVSG